MISRTLIINPVEPARLSLRSPLGIDLDLNLTFLRQDKSPVDPDTLKPQLVLLPRSTLSAMAFDVETLSTEQGLGSVTVPGSALTDPAGFTIEVYQRREADNPEDPPVPIGMLADGTLSMDGEAYRLGGPMMFSAPTSGGGGGEQGPPGPQGEPGPPGPQGAPGPQGLQGPPGAPGAPGTPGAQGNPGDPGATGATGATGAPGTPGATGATGATGTRGSLWFNGYGIPTVTAGRLAGDMYLDTRYGDIWSYDGAAWVLVMGPVPMGIQGSWRLTKRDEFDGTSLDLTMWTPNWLWNEEPTQPTQPVSTVENAAYDPACVVVGDNVLTFNAIASPITIGAKTYPNRSGIVQSWDKFAQLHGAFEARIWLDDDGTGKIANFPAFWLNGPDWPTNGEIDIAEGLAGQLQWAYHAPGLDLVGPANTANFTGWHTYGVEWQVGVIRFYRDGIKVAELTSNVVSEGPCYLVLNNAVGSSGGLTKIPSNMKVDYVRVWQRATQDPIRLVKIGTGTGPANTDLIVTQPTGIVSGDLLIAIGGLASTTAFGTDPAGWTTIGTIGMGGTRGHFWRKFATGTEGGTPVNFATTATVPKVGGCFAYRGVTSIVATATTTKLTPPTPSQVSITTTADNMVIVMMYIDGSNGSALTADWTGTGGITFDGAYRHPTNGDWVLVGSGRFAAAGLKTVGFKTTQAALVDRHAVITAISVK